MKFTIFFLFILILLPACSYQEVSEIDIPYYRQSDSGNCMQTQVKMALKYYYPEKDFSFEELDRLTGRTAGKWTWTSQLLPVLLDNGLNAYYYSASSYDGIKEGGEEYILEYYGEEDGRIMIDHTNFDSLYASIEKLEENEKFINERLDFSEIEKEFKKGHIVILIIDKSVLFDNNRPYAGHGVTITKINETHVSIHDSGGTPNLTVEKEQFIKAWNAPGTDNDAIIIRGKIN
ncbi:hypothetical protein KY343_05110 [Candidatus Woesearchaeota archaeon]|nr:hypothetical protein [Candidatus Woesearchaeota archaeon]